MRYCGLCLEVVGACFLGEVGSVGPQWRRRKQYFITPGLEHTPGISTKSKASVQVKAVCWAGDVVWGCLGGLGSVGLGCGAQVSCLSAFCFVTAFCWAIEMPVGHNLEFA